MAILGGVLIALCSILATVLVLLFVKGDQMVMVTALHGFTTPFVLALLGYGLQGIHKATNSALSAAQFELRVARAQIEELTQHTKAR